MEITIIPLIKIINKALVALVELSFPEKGVGWMIPFNKSDDLRISIEFDRKLLNSLGPIIKKNIKKQIKETNMIFSSSFTLPLIKNNIINGT